MWRTLASLARYFVLDKKNFHGRHLNHVKLMKRVSLFSSDKYVEGLPDKTTNTNMLNYIAYIRNWL